MPGCVAQRLRSPAPTAPAVAPTPPPGRGRSAVGAGSAGCPRPAAGSIPAALAPRSPPSPRGSPVSRRRHPGLSARASQSAQKRMDFPLSLQTFGKSAACHECHLTTLLAIPQGCSERQRQRRRRPARADRLPAAGDRPCLPAGPPAARGKRQPAGRGQPRAPTSARLRRRQRSVCPGGTRRPPLPRAAAAADAGSAGKPGHSGRNAVRASPSGVGNNGSAGEATGEQNGLLEAEDRSSLGPCNKLSGRNFLQVLAGLKMRPKTFTLVFCCKLCS